MTSSPFPPGSLLVAYLRDSGGNDQDLSVDQQEAEIRTWCADRGLILQAVYRDVATPGSSLIGRDQFKIMVRTLRTHKTGVAGVVIWKFSRFARNMDDAAYYKSLLRKNGYEIVSLSDALPEGTDGRFFEAAIDWMSHKFLEELSEDVRRGLRYNAEVHRVIPGTPPKGFKRQEVTIGKRRDGSPHIAGQWVPDPEDWEKCRQAFKMRAAGASYAQIQAATGLFGSQNSYPTFFANHIYRGELRYGEVSIPDYCEPLVDEATWQAVQAISATNKRVRSTSNHNEPNHPRRLASHYLLSGIARCALCGSLLTGETMRVKGDIPRPYYLCGQAARARSCSARRIPAEALHQVIIDKLNDYILDPQVIAAEQLLLERDSLQRRQHLDEQRADLAARLGNIRRKISNLVNLLADRGDPARSLLAKLSEFERQEAQIQTQIAELENSLQGEKYTLQSLENAQKTAVVIRNIFPTLDFDTRRRILKGILASVTVEREGNILRGSIDYYHPPGQFPHTSPENEEGGEDEDLQPPSVVSGGIYGYTFSLLGGSTYTPKHTTLFSALLTPKPRS